MADSLNAIIAHDATSMRFSSMGLCDLGPSSTLQSPSVLEQFWADHVLLKPYTVLQATRTYKLHVQWRYVKKADIVWIWRVAKYSGSKLNFFLLTYFYAAMEILWLPSSPTLVQLLKWSFFQSGRFNNSISTITYGRPGSGNGYPFSGEIRPFRKFGNLLLCRVLPLLPTFNALIH